MHSLVELCIKIAFDKQWPLDLQEMRYNISQWLSSHQYGKLVADQRAKE